MNFHELDINLVCKSYKLQHNNLLHFNMYKYQFGYLGKYIF